MPQYRILKSAATRLEEIYIYTQERWGDEQAQRYIEGLFDHLHHPLVVIFKRDVPVTLFFCEFCKKACKHRCLRLAFAPFREPLVVQRLLDWQVSKTWSSP